VLSGAEEGVEVVVVASMLSDSNEYWLVDRGEVCELWEDFPEFQIGEDVLVYLGDSRCNFVGESVTVRLSK